MEEGGLTKRINLTVTISCGSTSSTHSSHPLVFPNLPSHISAKILCRLPRYARAVASCVCRSWRDALLCSSINRGQEEEEEEEWLYISVFDKTRAMQGCMWKDDYRWLLFDPESTRTKTLTPPPLLRRFSVGEYGVQTISLRNNLFVLGLGFFDEGYDSLCYSDCTRDWSVLPHMETNRCFFACAGLGNFVYVAGGNDFIKKNLKSAERFDIEKNRWETLPDMIKARDLCSAFILNSKVYVIGGYKQYYGEDYHQQPRYKVHFTGEYFDPETLVWTLVPNMWPPDFWPAVNGGLLKPIVAVVRNKLYALKFNTDAVFEYDASQNRWGYIGSVGKSIDSSVEDCRLLGIGEELWVMLHACHKKDLCILVCNPTQCHSGGSLSFREVELNLEKRLSFLQFCGVFHVT